MMDDQDTSEFRGDADDANFGELMDFLTESREMRKTATSSIKQAAWAGGGAVAGGLLLGPPGGLVGGIVGSVVGYVKADNYDGALQAILKVEGARKKQLMAQVGKLLMKAGASQEDLTSTTEVFRDTLLRYAQQEAVRDSLWKACLESIRD